MHVVVSLTHIGFHCWPAAPDAVAFLRDRHRHVFHIRCEKPVQHSDRDIETLTLKDEIVEHLRSFFGTEFGTWSCEQIAQYLLREFKLSACEVLEDGENGARVAA